MRHSLCPLRELASYNAGPGRIAWCHNVEYVDADRLGAEKATHVNYYSA